MHISLWCQIDGDIIKAELGVFSVSTGRDSVLSFALKNETLLLQIKQLKASHCRMPVVCLHRHFLGMRVESYFSVNKQCTKPNTPVILGGLFFNFVHFD